jgi:two-component system response regulator AtoC
MITSEVIIENTLAALRGGAYDFISKPVNLEELQVTIRNGIEAQALRKEIRGFRRERARQFSFDQIIGNSSSLRDVIQLARKVATSEVSSILLQGESGTGKDLIAKAIHYASRRADAPFVAINCAAIPANLVESELFGYEKGAFTDAKIRKEGLFEQAEGGTFLLDEIGELELGLQAKLLRVLEEGVFRRVGGLKDVPLDARIAAVEGASPTAGSPLEELHVPTQPTYLFQLPPEGIVLEEIEMSLVKQALDRSGGNQTRAAEMLGISRDQLRYRLKKLEVDSAEG